MRHMQMQALVLGSIATHSLDGMLRLAAEANEYVAREGLLGIDGVFLSLVGQANTLAGLDVKALAEKYPGSALSQVHIDALSALAQRANDVVAKARLVLRSYVGFGVLETESGVKPALAPKTAGSPWSQIPKSVEGVEMSTLVMEYTPPKPLSEAIRNQGILAIAMGVTEIASFLPTGSFGPVVAGFRADGMSSLYAQAWTLWFPPEKPHAVPPGFDVQKFLTRADTMQMTGCEQGWTIGLLAGYKVASSFVPGWDLVEAQVGVMDAQTPGEAFISDFGGGLKYTAGLLAESVEAAAGPVVGVGFAVMESVADGLAIYRGQQPFFTPPTVLDGIRYLADGVCTLIVESPGAGQPIQPPEPIVVGPQLPSGEGLSTQPSITGPITEGPRPNNEQKPPEDREKQADEAARQADEAQALADELAKQADEARALADETKAQADKLKEQADQAKTRRGRTRSRGQEERRRFQGR